MTAADIALDMSVLYEMEFPLPCEHSLHGTEKGAALHDDGCAHWVFHYVGSCGMESIVLICNAFAKAVPTVGWWECSHCGREHRATEVELALEPIGKAP